MAVPKPERAKPPVARKKKRGFSLSERTSAIVEEIRIENDLRTFEEALLLLIDLYPRSKKVQEVVDEIALIRSRKRK